MVKIIISKNGWYQCDGIHKCGGTNFTNFTNYHCKSCSSFKKGGLKVMDKRYDTKLTNWS